MKKTLALILATCAAAPAAHADLFNTQAPRGESRVEFTSPEKKTEVCVVPKAMPGVDYGKDQNQTKPAELCKLDFYGATTVACPKMVSTNPGVDIQQLPAGMSAADYLAKECPKDENRAGKKLAKFKQSISCSYTPSILAYYHVAQALGGSIEVPETVIRTMDLAEHKKITAMGVKYGKDTILQTWKGWQSAEASPSTYKNRANLFTTDFEQTYGALSKNPGGEVKYSEINAGLGGFQKSQGWANVRNPAPIASMTKNDLASAAQKVIQMKDISNFLVMDYILSQQDRFGNIAARELFYSFDGKNVNKRKKKKNDAPKAGEVLVKEVLLKDNDCGMRPNDNVVKAQGMLQAVRHMAPKNYKKLLEFAASINKPETADYLKTELLLTADDLKSVQQNTADALKILQAACKSGALKLDLDLEAFLRGEAPGQAQCE